MSIDPVILFFLLGLIAGLALFVPSVQAIVLSPVFGARPPTPEELAHHYLWRFWRHVPRDGHSVIFDRSWYGRVLVERIRYISNPSDHLMLALLIGQTMAVGMAAAQSRPAIDVAFVHDRKVASWGQGLHDNLRNEVRRILAIDFEVRLPQ